MSVESSKTEQRIEAVRQIIDLSSAGSLVPRDEAKTQALEAARFVKLTGKMPDSVKGCLANLGIKVEDLTG